MNTPTEPKRHGRQRLPASETMSARVEIKMRPDMQQRIAEYAARYNMTAGEVIRRGIKSFLEEE